LAEAASRAAELQEMLESERERCDFAGARVAELEARMTDLRRQRDDDLRHAVEMRKQIEGLQRSLNESRSASEGAEADRHAALMQLEDAQAELNAWRARGEESERSLETERAHSADLNRALEEAWRKIEEMGAQTQALQAQAHELEDASTQHSERAAEALAEHVAEIERLTSREAELNAQLERILTAGSSAEQSAAQMQMKLETADSSVHHALARANEMEKAAADLRERLANAEAEGKADAVRLAAELATAEQKIKDLRASEESLKQRLQHLEATKFAASEKAERALKTLNLLQGQIRSLDDAATKVTALQQRLARIEEAWVEADETLEAVDNGDDQQVEVAVEQRQRLVEELDALNKARDVAVSSLRESVMRLRSISEREAPALLAPAPNAATITQQPEPEPVKTGNAAGGGRKWWKFGGA